MRERGFRKHISEFICSGIIHFDEESRCGHGGYTGFEPAGRSVEAGVSLNAGDHLWGHFGILWMNSGGNGGRQ